MVKSKKKIKSSVLWGMLIILVCAFLFSAYRLISLTNEEKEIVAETKALALNNEVEDYSAKYSFNKNDNADFVGWIVFDSGLVDLPIVQSADNTFYLNHGFYKSYSIYGTVFMDYQQSLFTQNITLYGHYVYGNDSIMFSPLQALKNQENYESNSTFSLYLEKEKRDYVISAVLEYDESGDNLYYQNTSFNDEDFEGFMKVINEHEFYDIDVDMSIDDNYVCLQTCLQNKSNKRLIIVGKEINVISTN